MECYGVLKGELNPLPDVLLWVVLADVESEYVEWWLAMSVCGAPRVHLGFVVLLCPRSANWYRGPL